MKNLLVVIFTVFIFTNIQAKVNIVLSVNSKAITNLDIKSRMNLLKLENSYNNIKI